MPSRRKPARRADYTAPGRRGEGPEAPVTAPRPSRRPPKERPPAPWGRFPLVELVILIGLVLLVVGFIMGNAKGAVLIACGLALASLAGLELAIREHLAGYRSHTTVLAGALAVVALAIGFFLLPSKLFGFNIVIGAIVFGISAYALRDLFKRRSGGLGFR